MNSRTTLFLALFFLSCFWVPAYAQQDLGGIRTIVLDAGHGGRDPGNLGTKRYKTVERDITLAVTLKLGEYIRENLPDVKVVYTRTTNKSVTLEKRAEIANEAKGDLFISIHCDSFTKSSVNGCTTIVLGKNHDDENRIAIIENSAILLEENYEQRYEGFDPKNPMSYIGLNLMQQTYLNESVEFASAVQYQFRERVQRKDRGVKQQPLYVTSRTAMPAVLIELGFLTNPAEEDFLNSERGQSYMASAIFRAIRDFKEKQDLLIADAIANHGASEGASGEKPKEEKTSTDTDINKPKEDIKPKTQEPLKVEPHTQPIKKEEGKPNTQGVKFAVQILTLSSVKKAGDPVFKGQKGIGQIEESGLFKYYIGLTDNFNEAQATAKRMQALGFKGAFVIGLDNGKKISATEARKKLR